MVREKGVVAFYEKDANKYEEERFSTERGRYEDKIQKDYLIDSIKSWENLKILEVGCGTGRFSAELLKHDCTVTALDPALAMLRNFKNKPGIEDKIRLINGDGYNLPFKDGVFDGCVVINVLSHMTSSDKLFTELGRVLKPNGFFIFNFPNFYSILLPVGLLVNLRRQSLVNPVYTKWYTLGKIKKSLKNAGFEIETVNGVLLPPVYPIPLKIIKKLNEHSRDSSLKYISTGVVVKAVVRK